MQLNRERQPSIRRNDRISKRETRATLPAPQFPITTFAMRGAAMIWDMQVETARTLWRTQARAAAMFGFPDYSRLFDAGERDVRTLVAATTEQVLDRAHEATATVTQLQREIERTVEQHVLPIVTEAEPIASAVHDADDSQQDIPRVIADAVNAPAEAVAQLDASAVDADVQEDVAAQPSEPAPPAREVVPMRPRKKHGKKTGRKPSRAS